MDENKEVWKRIFPLRIGLRVKVNCQCADCERNQYPFKERNGTIIEIYTSWHWKTTEENPRRYVIALDGIDRKVAFSLAEIDILEEV